jgi:hypothetical protein
VNVFGEPALPAQDLPQGQFEKLLRPSPGIPPSFGDRSSSYEDGENLLYLMMLTVGAEALLPKPAISFGHALAKVGRTNDASRRVKEVNCGFPENAFVRWKVERLHTYPNASEAHAAENDLKVLFADRFKSQGNEFFTGNRDQLVAAFDAYCAANAPRILGAPGKAKGI